MPIDVNELTGVPIVKVYGKWESKTSALLRGEIKRLSDQKQTQLIVHIYQCDYEIVPVLQTLSALLKFLIEKNILIALVSEDDLIKKWLAKARCSQEIVCSSNEEDARELLEK